MRSKFPIPLLILIITFSLITIGFSSWIISDGDTSYEGDFGDINADEIIKETFTTIEVTQKLLYSKDGFVGENGNVMKVKVTIDLVGCRRAFEDDAVLNVEASLGFASAITADVNILNQVSCDKPSQLIDLATETGNSFEYEITFTFDVDGMASYFNVESGLYGDSVFAVETKILLQDFPVINE